MQRETLGAVGGPGKWLAKGGKMKYYVVDQSGQKYGPADIATLETWAREGRVTGASVLEDEATGHRTTAAAVLGSVAFATQSPFEQRPGGPCRTAYAGASTGRNLALRTARQVQLGRVLSGMDLGSEP